MCKISILTSSFCKLIALSLLILLFPSSAARSQAGDDAYHQGLRQQLAIEFGLTGGDWLFLSDEAANINNIGVYGGTEKSITTVDGQPFTTAARLLQSQTPNVPWNIGAVQGTQLAVQEEDVVLITLWIRSIEAAAEDGYLRATFQDRTTFESSLFYPVLPTIEWQQIFIPFTIKKSNDARGAIFGMQLGAMAQTLEIGGLTGINYGSTVEVTDLPQTPQGTYAGQALDAPWRAAADQRIAEHRMADMEISVFDRNGAPIPNATVSVQMQEHAFRFGSAVSIPMLLNESPDVETYLAKLTNLDGNGHGFNSALLEWGLQWLPWEGFSSAEYTPERAVDAFTLVKEKGLTMRAHSLVWGGWRWLPPDMEANADDPAYLLQRVDDRLETILNVPELRGEIFEWDVVNEPKLNTDLAESLAGSPGFPTGSEINPYIFKKAEEIDPNVRLYINDTLVLNQAGLLLGSQQQYHQIIQDLIDAGARVDGIGLQSHMDYPLTAPERVYAVLDDFAVYDRELHISEYDVEIDDEAKAGEYTRDFLTIVFSHPSVTAFTMWNFWDPIHWKKNSPIFRRDWSVKPSGQAIFDLLFDEWWTDESGATDAAGLYDTRAFLGEYEIVVSYEGATAQQATTVVAGSNGLTVMLDVALPTDDVPPGDVNCDGMVSVLDALSILQFTLAQRSDAGACPLADPESQLNALVGDVSADGTADIEDALWILQCVVGDSNPFCTTPLTATVVKVAVGPQIDGEVDSVWSQAPVQQLGKTVLGDAVATADLSATVRMLATDDFLYALVEVVDDDLRSDSGEQWWEDDGVEIYLDGDRSHGAVYDGVNDAQLIFRWNEGDVIVGPNSVAAPAGLMQSMVQTADGYRLEVAIPAADFELLLTAGAQLGVDIHVIDDDLTDAESARENKIAWSAVEDELWRNPSLMGTAEVVDRALYRYLLSETMGWRGYLPLLMR